MVGKFSRGDICWANLGEPTGSAPGFRRPVLILQSNRFNESRIATIIAAMITSNIELAQAPGNVLLRSKESGLGKDSVVNISQITTLSKSQISEIVSKLDPRIMNEIESGVRLVLGLA